MTGRLTKVQKDKVAEFRAVAGRGATDAAAADCLRDCGWDVQAALNIWFQGFNKSYGTATGGLDSGAIDQLFDRYAEAGHDKILAEGIGRLCEDLEVDPSDVVMLVLSWRFHADIMCEYTRDEFVGGMKELSCDSIDKLKGKLSTLRAELKNERTFREVYIYAFSFAREQGQKILQLDTALAMWELLFQGRSWPHMSEWLQFLRDHHGKAISKDTWTQFYDFTVKIKPDFSDYDADGGAWPSLLDDFVEHMRAKRK